MYAALISPSKHAPLMRIELMTFPTHVGMLILMNILKTVSR
jgi:hypothetical protein